jgi:hypothetical protein
LEANSSLESFKTKLLFDNLEKIKREADELFTREREQLPPHLKLVSRKLPCKFVGNEGLQIRKPLLFAHMEYR